MAIDLKLYKKVLAAFKSELEDLHQSLTDGLLSLEKAHTKKELEENLNNLFRYAHNMKGAAASASVDSIAEMAHKIEDIFSDWREKKYTPNSQQISACLAVIDNFFPALKAHCDGEPVQVETYLAPLTSSNKFDLHTNLEKPENEFIKLPLKRLEKITAKANEMVTHQLKLSHWFDQIMQSIQQINQSDKVHAMTFALQKKLSSILNKKEQFLGQFARAVQALQYELKSIRLLPFVTLLSSLQSTVRNIALSLKKSVILSIDGGDIEVDKAIMDKIKDPLQHLVRNAIDHGIESDSERANLKKPIPAELKIKISQLSGKVSIQLIDDGRGIDIEKIKKHALDMQLYTDESIKQCTNDQILNCIFKAGFSLQEKVTAVSGRGVGLDIVQNTIKKMNGTIEVNTKLGQGTCFTLTLPLTLLTNRGLFFKVKEQLFMLPSLSVQTLYDIQFDQLKKINNQYVKIIENKPIPIRMLSHLLCLENETFDTHSSYFGLLLNSNEKQIIILVNDVIDEHECVVKPLPFPYTKLNEYIGTTLTSDETLVLILEPSKLVQMALETKTPIALKTKIENKNLLKKRVLIVDDSLTTRTLCANALEAAGYEAHTSNNGKNAWDRLQIEPFDAVISDIMMPKMDGFQLTEHIKKDKRLNHMPVILISSLDSADDKKHGLDVGANAYICKNEFDSIALIEKMELLL